MKIKNSIKLFQYYKSLGDSCLERLSFEELQKCPDDESNSMAIMVKHMWGNMLSRWTDFLTTDGEKEWRERDLEFVDSFNSKEEMLDKWNEGWDCLFHALNQVTDDMLDHIVYIRNEGHTVSEAIVRQTAHYSYHVGQMVYLAKMLKGKEWKSLSIPKNASKEYNQQKFEQAKSKKHFTDEV